VTEKGQLQVPARGLAAMRIGVEFGGTADFADSFERGARR
jgi:hypothetical protein